MQAKEGVIELLNGILTQELTGINQYFLHAKMCQNWGYKRLEREARQRSIDEMKHAEEIVERILFLEGVPNLQRLGDVNVGETVPEQFELDLGLEQDAVGLFTDAIQHCSNAGDYATRQMLERMVADEEDDVDWLETQLESIRQVGAGNYLAQQLTA
jgi:bacterioferritin